uniref:Non-structural protein 5 n=1 Tax=Ruddy turnstone rotavirus TaxID=2212774 RepID=A0A3G1RPG5_9REOV|nr:MAG: non-structural protein 5 [Ruddy turnstone rotavirus]
MAEASEFEFKLNKKKEIKKKTNQKTPVAKSTTTTMTKEDRSDVESNYSEESTRSSNFQYAEAYNKLQREIAAEENNDVKCEKTIASWADEVGNEEDYYDRPDTDPEDLKRMKEMKRRHNPSQKTEFEEDMNLEISALKMELERVKQELKPQGLDAAYNTVLRNINNLSTSQKHALVTAIVSSMK